MTPSTNTNRIRAHVKKVKFWLSEGREKSLAQHRDQSPGIQVCARLSDLLDTVVLEIFEAALTDLGKQAEDVRSQIALIPYGGYGRREMAPYSDVDLMLLHAQGTLPLVSQLAKRLVQDLSDVGVDLGFSLRTIPQTRQMAARDPIVFTSLVDSRFLGGSVRLYSRYVKVFSRMTRYKSHSLVSRVATARREERNRYGETVYLLKPNVKRSGGGLRDLQLLRWIGFARYGYREARDLERRGLLNRQDYQSLRKAKGFLLQLRNELHFHAGSAVDILDHSDQIRIAELYNYMGHEGQLPVEEFMQTYFQHTSTVRHVVGHFVDGASWKYPRTRRVAGMLTSHRVGRDFRVSPSFISATRQGLKKVQSNLADVLRLMELTGRYDCMMDHPTWRAIRDSMSTRTDQVVDREAAERFLSFLSHPNQLGRLLRRLHELRVLGKFVPGFEHARCLIQFNEYHKYTVDEHSIQAVERATEFGQESSVLGKAYNEIRQKSLFHLALLVHDLGKGFSRDHSEVGAEIAIRVADTLFLSDRETETLRFLVRHHLMLSHLAFRRDTSDERILLEHAAEIGSPSVMRMLFVLTCADLAAVGPGVLNAWKQEVLSDLYERMMDQLSGGVTSATSDRIDKKKQAMIQASRQLPEPDWFEEQIKVLPTAYLEGPTHEFILEDLERLRTLTIEQIDAWGRYLPERNAVEYSVAVHDQTVDGIFHRLTGALSAKGLEVLAAEIHTLNDGLCLDRFYVQDPDYKGKPPADRYEDVCTALIHSLEGDANQRPSFRRTWLDGSTTIPVLQPLETKVRVDNTTSDRYTIIDIFTVDQKGLLFNIARTLFELGLSVEKARIGTYLDQVVDVFYVTELEGRKLDNDRQIKQTRGRLLDAIIKSERTTT